MSLIKHPEYQAFPLYHIVTTAGIANYIRENPPMVKAIEHCLARHARKDFGDIDQHDKEQNEYAIVNRLRVLSSYQLNDMTKIWIITDQYEHATTILLPEEY